MVKLRTWTDGTGSFTIEAEFLGMGFKVVKLKKTDGSITEIPFEKLSLEDQQWIKSRRYEVLLGLFLYKVKKWKQH